MLFELNDIILHRLWKWTKLKVFENMYQRHYNWNTILKRGVYEHYSYDVLDADSWYPPVITINKVKAEHVSCG